MSELDRIIDKAASEGLISAAYLFATKRQLDEAIILPFMQAITAEFADNEAEKGTYPLSRSIAMEVNNALFESRPVFAALYANGEEVQLAKAVRVVVAGEVMNVLQDRLEEVMDFAKTL